MTATPPAPGTVVLIHGLWLTARSWEKWVERLETRGWRVVARSWPGLEGDVEEVRRDPSPLRGLGLTEVAAHYERIIRDLDRPPIIVGHSFGGVVTQILIDRGLGAAGVTLATAPIKGVLALPPSTLRTAWPALRNPFNARGLVPLSRAQFRYRFTNTLGEQESDAVYDRYYIPGTARPLFQAGLANLNPRAATRVDVRNDRRAPLLLIAGEADHVSPPSIIRATARLHRKSAAVTAVKVFAGRSHWLAGQEGWEEVADHALAWATSVGRSRAEVPT